MSFHRYNSAVLASESAAVIADPKEVFLSHMKQSFVWGITTGVIICTLVLTSC